MNKVSMDKKYKLRSGLDYEMLRNDLRNEYPVLGVVTNKDGSQDYITHKENGKFTKYDRSESENCRDLIEVSPYADFKIDDKVIVWDNDMPTVKYNHHFAGISTDGKAMSFVDGATSYSNPYSRRYEWDNCELYKEE